MASKIICNNYVFKFQLNICMYTVNEHSYDDIR